MKIYIYESIIGIVIGVLFCLHGVSHLKKNRKYAFLFLGMGFIICITFILKLVLWLKAMA